jgi:hypothetical protein
MRPRSLRAVQIALWFVTSATRTRESKLQRRLRSIGGPALSIALLSLAVACPAAIGARSEYGKLVAQGKLDATGTPKASFHGVRPARVFWLVVTNPAGPSLGVTWSVSCSNPAHKASGGATGEATIAHGHWAKRVRADWIKHPSYCSGRVEGLTDSGSLKIRVYAE